MKKTPIYLLVIIGLVLTNFGQFGVADLMAAENVIIDDINGSRTSAVEAVIYWTTNIESNCNLAYSNNSDTSNGTTLLGDIIQVALGTNDGKYHYSAKPSDLTQNTSYYYKILCKR